MNKLFLIITTFLITSCFGFSRDAGNKNIYFLSPVESKKDIKDDDKKMVVKVFTPKVSPGLEGNRIAFIKNSNAIDYVANARWVDLLPTMVQNTVIESLEDSRNFKQVVSEDSSRENIRVILDIKDFQIDNLDNKNNVKVKVKVKIIKNGNLKSFTFTKTKTAKTPRIHEYIKAFDSLFKELQKQIISNI